MGSLTLLLGRARPADLLFQGSGIGNQDGIEER